MSPRSNETNVYEWVREVSLIPLMLHHIFGDVFMSYICPGNPKDAASFIIFMEIAVWRHFDFFLFLNCQLLLFVSRDL